MKVWEMLDPRKYSKIVLALDGIAFIFVLYGSITKHQGYIMLSVVCAVIASLIHASKKKKKDEAGTQRRLEEF